MGEFHAPIVSCETTFENLGRPDWVVVDCRYDLVDKDKGIREYAKGHIPGAYFAHIDRDLSGPVGSGSKGRHPLPIPAAFGRWCATMGITKETQVVCYDDAAGQWASRLWWLLRHYGFTNVAVLDGGLTRWKALRLPLRATHEQARKPLPATVPLPTPGHMPTMDAEGIHRLTTAPDRAGSANASSLVLLDARAPERYRGEVEPVDKQAGHIPGAKSAPFAHNVGADMRFLSPDELRARFSALGAAAPQPTPMADALPPVEAPIVAAPPAEASAAAPASAASPSKPAKTASQIAHGMTREERLRAAAATKPAPKPTAASPTHAPARVVCYCGSGVTSAHNVLAMELAGLGTAALYPGSWSEWSWPEAKRPVAKGPE